MRWTKYVLTIVQFIKVSYDRIKILDLNLETLKWNPLLSVVD